MTIDESLLSDVDRVTAKLGTTRSAYIQSAVEAALRRHAMQEKERQHALGYRKHPAQPDEFDLLNGDPSWGEP